MAVILAPVMAASLLISHAIELTLPPAHIVGLSYYKLGNQTIDITVPASVPKYTALVITLYNVYPSPYPSQHKGNINIIGPGRKHIKAIIWSTFSQALHFNSDAFVKRVSYAGWQKTAVNKVCQKEFGKNANDVLSMYNSPVKINIPGVVPRPNYIIGLGYYELGHRTTTIYVQSSISNNTALIILLYGTVGATDWKINIVGPGRDHIKEIIWSTYSNVLQFNVNVSTKRLAYSGIYKKDIHKVALNEFGKNANDTILSMNPAPETIDISGVVPRPNYIIGLAFYQLGHRTTTINIPSSISNNTALIIVMYGTFDGKDGKINIAGPGRDHIKQIVWSTHTIALQFNVEVYKKRLDYSGIDKTDINKVAQKEFGKNANDTMYMYTAPETINISGVIKPPAYIAILMYYKMSGKDVNMTVPDTLPNNTALLVFVYEPFGKEKVVHINVFGPGRDHIHTIVWGTYSNGLAFNLNVNTKRVGYPGYFGKKYEEVALEMFGKKSDVLYDKYTSPTNIILTMNQ